MTLPRGDVTENIFDRAVTVTRVRHNAITGEDSAHPISADEAAELFALNTAAEMQCRDDGVYVFVIYSGVLGYERVEVEVDH